MNLKELQQTVYDAVNPYSELKPLTFIKESEGIKNEDRLFSYYNSSKLKMLSCIEDDFSVTQHFIKVHFDELIEDFLKQNPGDTHYINEIARTLPKYIKNNRKDSFPDFINDLVQLEWLMIESFYNFFDYRTPQAQKGMGQEARVNDSAIIFKSQWPIHKIWHDEKSYIEESTIALIWATSDRRVHVESLNPFEYEVILTLKNSPTLAQAVDELTQKHDTQSLTEFFTAELPKWVQKGIVEANL